jgi:2-oxoglutarate-dependent dioxygenase
MFYSTRLASLKKRYDREGVVELGRVLDSTDVDRLRSLVDRLIFNDGAPSSAVRDLSEISGEEKSFRVMQLVNVYQLNSAFAAVFGRSDIVEIVEGILRSPVGILRDQVFYKPPKVGGEVYMHQDNRYWHLDPPKAATLWIALDDATLETGCVHFIKGSHKIGRVDHRRACDGRSVLLEAVANKSDSIPIEVRAGHATLHDCQILHWSPENRSTVPRRAYTVQYVAAGVKARGEEIPDWQPLGFPYTTPLIPIG